MYVSVNGSAKTFFKHANLAATYFFDPSIPVLSLFLSFGRLSNMGFSPSYFFYFFLQQTSKLSYIFETNWMISPHSQPTNRTYSFKIIFRRVLLWSSISLISLVLDIYLVLLHIKSGNISEHFSHLTYSKIDKVTITPCKWKLICLPLELLTWSNYARRHYC